MFKQKRRRRRRRCGSGWKPRRANITPVIHKTEKKEKKESRVLPGIYFKYFLEGGGGLLLSAFLSMRKKKSCRLLFSQTQVFSFEKTIKVSSGFSLIGWASFGCVWFPGERASTLHLCVSLSMHWFHWGQHIRREKENRIRNTSDGWDTHTPSIQPI